MKKTIILYFLSLIFTLLFVFFVFVERQSNGSIRYFIFEKAYSSYWSDSDYFTTRDKFDLLIENNDEVFIKSLHEEYGNNISYEIFNYLLKIDERGLTRYENFRFNWSAQKKNTIKEIRQKYIDSGLIDPNADDQFMYIFASKLGHQLGVAFFYPIGGLLSLIILQANTYIY